MIESGWGTSRYLRGKCVYGQYTFEKNIGIEPAQRDKQKFFIRKLKIYQNY